MAAMSERGSRTPTSAYSQGGEIEKADPTSGEENDRFLSFNRVELLGLNLTLGCAIRSAITGEIDMKRMKRYPDYCIVDLYDRPHLPSSLLELKKDKYLFRPVPLMNRTWLYHALFDAGFIVPGEHEENQVIRYILNEKCIDAPTSTGLGSPLQCYVPLSFGVCLIGDMIAVVVTIFFLAVLRKICVYTNTPEYYYYSRAVSLPCRITFLAFLLQWTAGSIQDFVQICGVLLVIAAWIFDLIIGDVTFLLTYRLNCRYDIITCLGNRTYVCYRHGAMGQEEAFGERGRVEEEVSGMAVWERSHILIADIGDLIVELRPLSENDWDIAMEKYYVKGPLPYICTRVFQEVEDEPEITWASPQTAADKRRAELNAIMKNQSSPLLKRPAQDVILEDF